MRRFFCATLLLIVAWTTYLPASAQELLLPRAPHRNGELRHSYAVLASEKYAKSAADVVKKVQQQLDAKNMAIYSVGSLDSLPDFVVVLDDLTTESEAIIAKAKASNASVLLLAPKSNANVSRVLDALKTAYYRGVRPEVSTVFTAGEGYPEYRIPSVVATADGTIVAFIEARAFSHKDQAENDIVAKISTDGGKTWGEIITIASDGEASLNNPMAVYVEECDRIILLYQRFPPKATEGTVRAGGDAQVLTFACYSDDKGRTWSTPRDVTAEVRPADAGSYCSGPGVGIKVTSGANKGRIVLPFNVNGSPTWYNYLVYSDDLGDTWHIAAGRSAYGTNESQVVQLTDSTFLVNARSHRNIGDDQGIDAPKGWSPWNFNKVTRNRANIEVVFTSDSTTRWALPQIMANQPDPTCQGSIIRYSGLGLGGKSVLLLSNPASQHTWIEKRAYQATPPMRVNGTVKVSLDEGQTWAHAKRIYGDRMTEFQYSVLVKLPDGRVGCIFEANENIQFAVLDLAWLTGGAIVAPATR